ncbi:NADP-dependent malic enzyme [compost metagenome]
MASNPIVFAYAGPFQAILPWQAREIRTDLILATDSFDHPNELANCLASPFVFRGALDVRARCINEAMKIAAIRALHLLALQPVPLDVLRTYNVDRLVLGKDYIVPKPLDGRLHSVVAGAVARAAIDSGEARISFPAHYPSIYPFFYPFLVDVPSPLFDHGQSS